MREVADAVKNMSQVQLAEFITTGRINLCGHALTSEDINVSRTMSSVSDSNIEVTADPTGTVILLLDFTPSEDLLLRALLRDLCSKVQRVRKNQGLKQVVFERYLTIIFQDDDVEMIIKVQKQGDLLIKLSDHQSVDYIKNQLRRGVRVVDEHFVLTTNPICEEMLDVQDEQVTLIISRK